MFVEAFIFGSYYKKMNRQGNNGKYSQVFAAQRGIDKINMTKVSKSKTCSLHPCDYFLAVAALARAHCQNHRSKILRSLHLTFQKLYFECNY